MNILVDMNLSPEWVSVLQDAGWDSAHWSSIGNPKAADPEILAWAREHNHVLFTHDLDFGAILAAIGTDCPSVIQARTDDVTPEGLKDRLILLLHQYQDHLDRGALIVIDEKKLRVRILPLNVR